MLSTQLEKGGRSERDKLDRCWSTKLTTRPSPDARLLVYHSDRQALSAARFFHACLGLNFITGMSIYVAQLLVRQIHCKSATNRGNGVWALLATADSRNMLTGIIND